jgi:hypothetical protein
MNTDLDTICMRMGADTILARHNTDMSAMAVKMAMVQNITSGTSDKHRQLAINMIKIARMILDRPGALEALGGDRLRLRENQAYFDLLHKNAEAGTWSAQLQKMAVEPVIETLGQLVVHKSAADWSETGKNLFGGAASLGNMSFQTLKALYGLALLTGAGIGTIGWNMDRDSRADTAQMEAGRAKADYYDQATRLLSESTQRQRPAVAY